MGSLSSTYLSSSRSLLLQVILISLLLTFFPITFSSSSNEQTPVKDVDLENPSLEVIPLKVGDGTCERVRLVAQSRLNLRNFANAIHVLVKVSSDMPGKYHENVQICFHRNASIGLCHCEKEWGNLQKGQWNTIISPFEYKYMDVRFSGGMPGSVTISIEKETQHWRVVCLVIGFVLLLLAPFISKWTPFYYSSSMILGVLLVVLFLLFQGMKLLPTGRKNFLYLTLYGSLVGAGSLLMHYFSAFVNSILLNFGLSEDMHNPVSIFVLVGVVLAGAALGFWIVRKFVLSEDGDVDMGIAQFVKWAMNVTAIVFIFQSTLDYLLALITTIICWRICSAISFLKLRRSSSLKQAGWADGNLWRQRARQAAATHRQAEFLSRSGQMGSKRTSGRSPPSRYAWSNTLANGSAVSYLRRRPVQQQDYYSTFHKTPVCKFSRKEWNDFTRESTRNALSDWASSPEVTDWIAKNAHRIHLEHKEKSIDSMESSSGSSEETVVESTPSFFRTGINIDCTSFSQQRGKAYLQDGYRSSYRY